MSVNKLPSAVSDTAVDRCFSCNKRVVNDKYHCGVCRSVYHASCAVKIDILPNGGYEKCCESKSDGEIERSKVPTINPRVVTDEEHHKLVQDIGVLVMGSINERLDEMVKAMVTGVCGDMEQNFTNVRQSIDVLQKTVEDNESTHNNDIAGIHLRIDSVEAVANTRIKDVTTSVQNAVHDLNILKAKVNNAPAGEVSNGPAMVNYLNEVEDRLSRKQNAMIYGVEETQCGDKKQRLLNVQTSVANLFGELSFNESVENIKIQRIGKYSPHLPRPRPIKLILTSADKATSLIQAASRMKKLPTASATLKRIQIWPDRTELQRQQSKALKIELEQRKKDEHNQNLKIWTMNGVSKIISMPPRAHPHQQ